MANSHPGSYCGQDAYSDMLVTDNGVVHRKRTSPSVVSERESRCAELYGRSTEIITRGGEEPLSEKNKTVVNVVLLIKKLQKQHVPKQVKKQFIVQFVNMKKKKQYQQMDILVAFGQQKKSQQKQKKAKWKVCVKYVEKL